MAGRKEKLGKQIQKDLGEILDAAAKQILKGTMVTVLEVVVTSDLGLAKVHISLFNTQDKAADLVLIQQNSPQIRHYLAQKMKDQVRKIPELLFFLDERIERAEKIERLLKNL